MSTNTAIPIKASTQEHLEIEDIQDDIVILKTGACGLVIQVTAINFGLLSESEQDAIIFAYAGLLNSLTFSIQIIVRSNIKDVTEYIRLIRKQESKQKKALLLEQLVKYRQFVENTVRENQVLDKKFYVVIPFTTLELGLANTISTSFQKKKVLPYPKSYILERAKMNLYPKRDHLFRQFSRLGLQSRQLNTQQLLELFYNFYNLESIGQKFIPTEEYNNPIVQPAIGNEPEFYKDTPNPFKRVEPLAPNTPTTPFPNSQSSNQAKMVQTNFQNISTTQDLKKSNHIPDSINQHAVPPQFQNPTQIPINKTQQPSNVEQANSIGKGNNLIFGKNKTNENYKQNPNEMGATKPNIDNSFNYDLGDY